MKNSAKSVISDNSKTLNISVCCKSYADAGFGKTGNYCRECGKACECNETKIAPGVVFVREYNVEVFYGDGYSDRVYVTRPNYFKVKVGTSVLPEPATVNWPAIGSSTPEVTENFAKALLKAVKIARRLNKKAGVK